MLLLFVFVTVLSADGAYEGDLCKDNGVDGICTNLKNCSTAIENLRNKKLPQPKTCSFMKNDVIVCCTEHKVTETRQSGCEPILAENTSKFTGRKAWDKCIEYQEKYVFPCEESEVGGYRRVDRCHHTAGDLFSGGLTASDAKELQFPHMALMGFQRSEGQILWQCGGVLISEKFVLTAGHCVANRYSDPLSHVMIGGHRRSDLTSQNTYEVKQILIHEDFKPPVKYNDIALVELDREVPLDHRTVPACLHTGLPINASRAVSSGWGYTETSNENSMTLHKTVELEYSTSECAARYPPHRQMPRGIDAASQICYGDRREGSFDSCQGDSGGPLQIEHTVIACMYNVIGVTSFGVTCGRREPGVYTRVVHYLPWIESVVWP